MMRTLLLALIRGYQRYLSPHKGFSCAYRMHTGRSSCSTLGFRAVRRFGVLKGLALTRGRTRRCGVAQRRYAGAVPRTRAAQRGECDCGDLPCDGTGGSRGWFNFCDCCDIASCCDWPDRKKQRRGRRGDETVRLPPQRQ